MTKKPSYRFVGFEDEWKEVKLGEVYSFSQGQQVPVEEQFEQINENRIRFIRIVDLTNKGEEMRYIEFKSSTGRVYEKDIFFVRYGAVGVVGIGYDGIIANNLFKLNPQMSVDNKFMYVQFNREKFKKTLQGFSASTTMPAISFTDIRTIDIYLPSLPEQTAIGSFFQDIDQLISLQQRKLEVLKEQKKTYLKLLFPAKGQTKPAFRFAGFEDDWKRKNFGDFLVEFNEKTIVENQHELLSSTNNGIEPRKGRVSGESNIGYKVLKKDMIVLSPQNLWLGNINYNVDYESGIVSPSYKIFNVLDIDKKFISILIRHPYMNYEYGQASVQGASVVRRNLDIDLFNTIQILLPSLEEQTLIGSFFLDLDKAIAKQEEKVKNLKESKQTLLRKMFI